MEYELTIEQHRRKAWKADSKNKNGKEENNG